MKPEFTTVRRGARVTFPRLAPAIIDARFHRVPVLCDGVPVTWRAAREGGRVRLTAWLAGGAR
jgi:hypothetical protein